MKRRMYNDKVFNLRYRVSNAVNKALKKQNAIKNNSTWKVLPYTPQQLKEHLENQFNDKMNWENYGIYWNIDHIYPQSLLPYDSLEHPNFLKCWCLENLQPLEKIENIKKSNKIPQKRIPDINKAKNLLNFTADISLDESIDEVVSYMKQKNE